MLRPAIFMLMLFILLGLEYALPARKSSRNSRRFLANISIFILDMLITRGLIIVGAVSGALWAQKMGFGLFNAVTFYAQPIPLWAQVLMSFLILDIAVWGQHLLTHLYPPLWRLHRMHHSDLELDVTTALRFHPLEIGLSLIFKAGVCILIGAPIIAVISFEIALNSLSMFNHANIQLPYKLDKYLRKLIVTPALHRVHHSMDVKETNSNYGTIFSLWDHLFGTFKAQPKDTEIGLQHFRAEHEQSLPALILQPLKKNKA